MIQAETLDPEDSIATIFPIRHPCPLFLLFLLLLLQLLMSMLSFGSEMSEELARACEEMLGVGVGGCWSGFVS